MPVYLVTDRLTDVRTMVEASRPAGALSALIDNRFDVSPALDATDALKHMSQGVPYITAPGEQPLPDDAPEFAEVDEPAPERPSLEAFAAAADADENVEEDVAPAPSSSGWSTEAEETLEMIR